MIKLTYVIKYVDDMDRAVRFYRDELGFPLRFQSPGWSEFETGGTTLALHAAADDHTPGDCQLGFGVPDLDKFHAEKKSSGIEFTSAPNELFGSRIARFKDCEGAECSVSGK